MLGTIDTGEFELTITHEATGRDLSRGLRLQQEGKATLEAWLTHATTSIEGSRPTLAAIAEWDVGIVDAVIEAVFDTSVGIAPAPDNPPLKYPKRYRLGTVEELESLRDAVREDEEAFDKSELLLIALTEGRKVKHTQEAQRGAQHPGEVPFLLLASLLEFEGEKIDVNTLLDTFTAGQIQAMLPIITPKKPTFKPIKKSEHSPRKT